MNAACHDGREKWEDCRSIAVGGRWVGHTGISDLKR